jgi:quercetin dioxygenase-like cupin family protein
VQAVHSTGLHQAPEEGCIVFSTHRRSTEAHERPASTGMTSARAMRALRLLAAMVVAATIAAAGVALADHVTQVEPSTVPTGFLAAHNEIDAVGVNALARAVKPDGAELYIQHARLGAGQATGWHTHPGPVLVAVVKGTLTYEDAHANRCRRITYSAGEGFTDPGFGHVHRAIAGPSGAEFYPVYILPKGADTHVIPETAPEECAS